MDWVLPEVPLWYLMLFPPAIALHCSYGEHYSCIVGSSFHFGTSPCVLSELLSSPLLYVHSHRICVRAHQTERTSLEGWIVGSVCQYFEERCCILTKWAFKSATVLLQDNPPLAFLCGLSICACHRLPAPGSLTCWRVETNARVSPAQWIQISKHTPVGPRNHREQTNENRLRRIWQAVCVLPWFSACCASGLPCHQKLQQLTSQVIPPLWLKVS